MALRLTGMAAVSGLLPGPDRGDCVEAPSAPAGLAPVVIASTVRADAGPPTG